MSTPSPSEKPNSSVFAKEALLALAKRKLPATPTNYTLMYQEITRGHGVNSMTAHEAILLLTARLPDRALAETLQQAAEEDDWRTVSTALQQGLMQVGEKADTADETGDKPEIVPATAPIDAPAWESSLALFEKKRATREPVTVQHGMTSEVLAQRLCDLMQLLLFNIVEIVPEADVVKDQVEKIDSLLAGLLTMGRLDEVERAIRSMLVRGGIVRHGMEEAKEAIKTSVGKLIERLSTMSNATADYSGKLAVHANAIAKSANMTALSYQINDLLQDTELLSDEMIKARSDLTVAQQHASALENRARELEQELAKLQKRVHTDPLTDMLDRRAMEEVYAEEIIRADRNGRALCLALIDINDLRKLAEQHGATLTVDALKYLLDVIKRMTRPSDSVARYGENQMTILLVGAKRDDAVMVMTRLIRELTKSFFMRDDQHILLTFSCGVAQIEVQAGFSDALDRAEGALKEALRQGQNLVLGG